MLFSPRLKPIVFGGPSLELVKSDYLENFEVRPPVERGDLYSLLDRRDKPRCVLITDGVFGGRLAIPPVECMDFINRGSILIGCSSIGALRAADCRTAGMIGIGGIFLGYSLGYYHSDADVAVMYGSNGTKELTVSLVHADAIACTLDELYGVSRMWHRQFLRNVRSIPWYERFPDAMAAACAKAYQADGSRSKFLDVVQQPAVHPKKVDALLACEHIVRYYLKRGSN